LTDLYLSGNQLSSLPTEIGQLTNLTGLYIRKNQLSSHPAEIVKLTNLTNLDLGENQLSSLPAEIVKLTNLTDLYLSGNQLSSLPTEIGQLTNLTGLYIRKNQLSSLPAEIVKLTNLIVLDLRENQLNSLPAEISQIPIAIIDNNPLTNIPDEIVEQGSDAILTYLKEIFSGFRRQWVSKLVFVGEGGVGKTCLLRSLQGKKFVESPTTRGIEIHSLKLPHEYEEDVELMFNAWDFGGQEIYHATHQFFLTNRSLFILAWNARHGYEQGKLYYWLDAIQARAPQSPILVVATWTDERDADLPTADLKRKYPQIVDFFDVSNKDVTGILELRNAIMHTACNHLPLMGEKWPETWLNAANEIRSLNRRYISPNQLFEIMEIYKVSKAGAKVLARWMHELGELLYFSDENDLDDLIILKPQWVTKYTSLVLDSDDVIGRDGIFTDEHMEKLWPDLDPVMQQYFLRLMEKFDLSYRTLDNEEVSLVVERLPLDPPNFHDIWDQNSDEKNQHEISIKYELNTLLPGIPTWFIARSHRFTTHTHWRFGAVFENTKENYALGLIQSDPQGHHMQLTVRGTNPHSFFALLKDGLERTLERYPGINPKRTIPCPGHNGIPCDYEFDLNNLLRAIEQDPPVESVQCQHSFQSVSVSQLLFGIHWRSNENIEKTLQSINQNTFEILSNQVEEAARYQDLLTILQRSFAKIHYTEQSREDTFCPNLFVLRPHQTKTWKKVLHGEKLEMQLYCQAPGYWHPTEHGGYYVFDYPPQWFRNIGNYLGEMVKILKYVTPLIGPWIGVTASEYSKLIDNDIKMMNALVEALPDIEKNEPVRVTGEYLDHEEEIFDIVKGAPLRSIRVLLDKLDKNQVWGGLQRVLTPEGHYLWLCEHHAQEYRIIK
jgi:small GTP-binding protein